MFKRLMGTVDRLLGRGDANVGGRIDEEFWDGLEEGLIEADTHPMVVQQLLAEMQDAVRDERLNTAEAVKARLQKAIADRFRIGDAPAGLAQNPTGPSVYLFVGVNGAGKTTTIAKLGNLLTKKYGAKVIVAAGDTFRAAAIEQLDVWANRIGAEIVKAQPGADSATVVFDAITAAKARGADFVLCDTAGRQHSKANLMAELEKVARVTQKALGHPPSEVLLVLDANTGQNAVRQAEEFTKVAGVTGIVLTKLDGTARGGALIGMFERLKVPIKFIGVGEKVDDLQDFRPDRFAAQLFE